MMKGFGLVMTFAFNLHVVYGFIPAPQFFKTIPNIQTKKSLEIDVKNLKKQQEYINQTMATLNALVNQNLAKVSMDESMASKQGFINKTMADLRADVNQALANVADVESHTAKEVSALKSQLKTMIVDIAGLSKQMKKVLTEVTVKKKSNDDKKQHGTQKQPDVTMSGKTSNNVQGKPDSERQQNADLPNGGSCPTSKGYHQLSKTLCVRHSDASEPMTWYDSVDDCKRDGGDLISFSSKTEQEKVIAHLAQQQKKGDTTSHTGPNTASWVGMWRRSSLGDYSWLSNSQFYGIWGRNQPTKIFGFKCVNLASDGLYDDTCRAKRRYMCRINLEPADKEEDD